jgi:hypothetical protein
VQLQYPVQE